jgi:hypothetical protein
MSSHVHGVRVAGHGDGKSYIYVNDVEGLVSLVQMGTIELHAWNATVDDVKHPDRIIFDLDPAPDVPWDEVRRAAIDVRANLKKFNLVSFLKTRASCRSKDEGSVPDDRRQTGIRALDRHRFRLVAMAFMADDDFAKPPFSDGHVAAASVSSAKPPAIIAVVAIESTVNAMIPVAAVRSYAQVQLCQRSPGLRTNSGRACPRWNNDQRCGGSDNKRKFPHMSSPSAEVNDLLSHLFLLAHSIGCSAGADQLGPPQCAASMYPALSPRMPSFRFLAGMASGERR